MRVRLVLLAAALAALLAAGCAGSGSAGSGVDPLTVVPADSSVWLAIDLDPGPKEQANIDAIAGEVFGIPDLGEFVIGELESLEPDAEIDFETDIEPWVGKRAGVYLSGYDGEDFQVAGGVLEITDPEAAQDFIDERTEEGDDTEVDSYEGVEYAADDDAAVGIVEGVLAVADSEGEFKSIVDASIGRSLADEKAFERAMTRVPAGSVAELFVDVGALVEEGGSGVDSEFEAAADLYGFDLEGSTISAGLVPGADRLELELLTDIYGGKQPGGDLSGALAAVPAGSVGAIAETKFGEGFAAGFESAAAEDDLERGELEDALKEEYGVDIVGFAASLGEAVVFFEGHDEESLGAAAIVETDDPTVARNTISNIAALLEDAEVGEVKPLRGGRPGFSVHTAELGQSPVIATVSGNRVVIGLGTRAVAHALAEGGPTLGETPGFRAAAEALGEIPIAGYAVGPQTLDVIADLVGDDEDFEEAEPYLEKISYVAYGFHPEGKLTAAKLVVGFDG